MWQEYQSINHGEIFAFLTQGMDEVGGESVPVFHPVDFNGIFGILFLWLFLPIEGE